MKKTFLAILNNIKKLPAEAENNKMLLQGICEILESRVEHYDWVGFYLVNEESSNELVLGPYVGAKTEHTHISFGKGICGQVANTHHTFIVQDVREQNNYLACSLEVRSEIVEPIM